MEKRIIDLEFLKNQQNSAYLDVAFDFIRHLSQDYPGFSDWYKSKVVSGIYSEERKIIIYTGSSRKIAGISIIKNTEEEKKLCTIRVAPEFRRMGVGRKLFESSFELLNTDSPVITVSSPRMPQFKKILSYYGFKLEDKMEGIYSAGHSEYIFNGNL